MPHDLAAERAVLGALISGIADQRCTTSVFDVLQASDFYLPAHAQLFALIRRMVQSGEAVDIVTVCSRVLEHDARRRGAPAARGAAPPLRDLRGGRMRRRGSSGPPRAPVRRAENPGGLVGTVDAICDALGFHGSTADPSAPIVRTSVEPFQTEWAATWFRADGHACVAFARTESEARAILLRQPGGPPDALWLPIDGAR